MPASMNAGAALSRHHEISTMTHAAPERLPLRVHALRRIADHHRTGSAGRRRIASAHRGRRASGSASAGGLTRSYSLTNPGDASGRYVLAVALDAASRGGSAYIHARLRPGDTLQASGPRNHFPLAAGAPQHPHRRRHRHHADLGHDPAPGSRATRLAAALCRALARRAAYLDVLLQRYPDRFSLHVDDEAGGAADLAGFLRTAPADAQLYCCGPAPMLDAFESATADRQPSQVHLERFRAAAMPPPASP